jgi:hypothetical protein
MLLLSYLVLTMALDIAARVNNCLLKRLILILNKSAAMLLLPLIITM